MKKVTPDEFKKHCSDILDAVCATRNPVLICKGNKIIAQLIPFGTPPKEFLGCLAGVMEIVGDIELPLWPTGA